MNANLETLLIVGSRIEAEIIAGSLKSSGIHAHISADDEGGMNIAMQLGRVRILISPEDEAEAREVLKDMNLVGQKHKAPNGFQKWIWKLLGGESPQGN